MATSASSKEMETPGPVMVQFIRNGNPRSSSKKWKPRSSYGPTLEKHNNSGLSSSSGTQTWFW